MVRISPDTGSSVVLNKTLKGSIFIPKFKRKD
nr:MAG TPA: hypothetical protein [Caudoviricetes sp.]